MLESNGKANILDRVTVHIVDVETHKLLLRFVVPSHAGEVPAGNENPVLIGRKGARTTLRQGLAIDGHIGVSASIFGLENIETEGLKQSVNEMSLHKAVGSNIPNPEKMAHGLTREGEG